MLDMFVLSVAIFDHDGNLLPTAKVVVEAHNNGIESDSSAKLTSSTEDVSLLQRSDGALQENKEGGKQQEKNVLQKLSFPHPIDLASPSYYEDSEEIPPSPTPPLMCSSGIEEDQSHSSYSSSFTSSSSPFTSSSSPLTSSSLLSSSASSAPSSLLSDTPIKSPTTTTSPAFAALSLFFPYSPPPPSPSRCSAPPTTPTIETSPPYSYDGQWCEQEKLFKVQVDLQSFPMRWRFLSIYVSAEDYEEQQRTIDLVDEMSGNKSNFRSEHFILGGPGFPYYYRGNIKVPFQPLDDLIAVALDTDSKQQQQQELPFSGSLLSSFISSSPSICFPISLADLRARIVTQAEGLNFMKTMEQDDVIVFGFMDVLSDEEKQDRLHKLASLPGVAEVGQIVNVDKKSVAMLTRRFVVKFNSNVSLEAVSNTISSLPGGLIIKRQIQYADNCYEIESSEFKIATYDLLNICALLTDSSLVRYAEPDLNCTLIQDSDSGTEQEVDVSIGRDDDDDEEEFNASLRYIDRQQPLVHRSFSANDVHNVNSDYRLFHDFSKIFGHCNEGAEDSSDEDDEGGERMIAINFPHFGGTPEKRRRTEEEQVQ